MLMIIIILRCLSATRWPWVRSWNHISCQFWEENVQFGVLPCHCCGGRLLERVDVASSQVKPYFVCGKVQVHPLFPPPDVRTLINRDEKGGL